MSPNLNSISLKQIEQNYSLKNQTFNKTNDLFNIVQNLSKNSFDFFQKI